MKLAITTLSMIIMISSSAAYAAPAFLSCTIPDSKTSAPPTLMEVQLNEGNGTVSWSFQNGDSFTKRAIFAPDKVSFGGFQVSRLDLSIIRFNDGMYANLYGGPWEDHGKCEIAKQQRAF